MGGTRRKAEHSPEPVSEPGSDESEPESEADEAEQAHAWERWQRICAVQAAAAGRAAAACTRNSRGTTTQQWQPLAVKAFREMVVGEGKPKGSPPAERADVALKRFIVRWEETFRRTGSVDDRPRSGRPRLLPSDEVAMACELVRQQGLSSQEAYNKQPLFQRLLSQYGCSTSTLWRRIHELDPSLSKCL